MQPSKIGHLFRAAALGAFLSIIGAGPSAAQSISGSQNHLCALDGEGSLYCWGSKTWTHGNPIPFDSSGRMPSGGKVKLAEFHTGWLHDCGRTTDGIVYCGGNNSRGELGRPMFEPCPPVGCGLPSPIEGDRRYVALTVGEAHACALTAEGVAYCWGANDAGQTGIGGRANAVDRPTRVVGDYRFKSIEAGDRHTCGISTTDVVLCWGANNWGQLGSNPAKRGCRPTSECMAVPAPVDEPRKFASLYAGYGKTCGLTGDGALFCWGKNYSKLVGETAVTAVQVGANAPFVSVAPGYWFSCGVVRGGKAYCWREEPFAQVGRDLATFGCGAAQVCVDEVPVSDSIRFKSVTAGEANACGLATTGGIYCWGVRDVGRWGQGPSKCVIGQPNDPKQCNVEPYAIGGGVRLAVRKYK